MIMDIIRCLIVRNLDINVGNNAALDLLNDFSSMDSGDNQVFATYFIAPTEGRCL